MAAIARAQTAVKDYQGVPAVREAMQILVNSYDALGLFTGRSLRAMRTKPTSHRWLMGSKLASAS